MKKYIFSVILVLCFILFDGCHKKKHSNRAVSLNSAMNVVINGKNIILQYNTSSQLNGFSISFSNVGSATCADVSIQVTSAYGFVPNSEIFIPSPINSSMPQYTCTQNGTNISLFAAPPLSNTSFRPWVDNFTITIGQTVFTLTVDNMLTASQTLTRAANIGGQVQMNLNDDFPGCGLIGTILQRVYDCSKMITNYGATVTGDAGTPGTNAACDNGDATNPRTCEYYTPFRNPNTQDPSLFWFVVSCPAGSVSPTVPQQSCSWLTPIVAADQPALDNNLSPNHFPLFTLATLSNAYQSRLLFSGKMTNDGSGYTFEDTNGYPTGTTPFNQTYANSNVNPGNGATTQTPPFTASVCITDGGGSLSGGGTMGVADAALRDSLSSTTGATVTWQVPNYPMLNIITGGSPTSGGHPTCVSNAGGDRAFCDEPLVAAPNGYNRGFNAINVPGFANTDAQSVESAESLWSSSSSNRNNFAWIFLPVITSSNNGLVAPAPVFNPNPSLSRVRCISPTWF